MLAGVSVIGLTPVNIVNSSLIAVPTGNQSVSGTVQTQVQGSVAVAIISGSIAATFTPPANQSVSGTIQADIRGSVATVIIGGSIATATTNSSVMLLNGANTIGSITALQGTNPYIMTGSVQGTMSVLGTVPVTQATASNPWIVTGSVQGSFSPSGNQSVSGTVQVDVRGSVAVAIISGSIAASFTPPANQSVSGTVGASLIGLSPVSVSNFPTTQNVSGSVVATQGTNPWTVVSSIAGGIFPISGSVAATIVGTPNVNTAGSVVAFQGTIPWANTNVGSIITVGQGSIAVNIIAGSIAASFTPPANQSVSGTVQVDVRGSIAAVIIGGSIATATTNSSVMLLTGTNMVGSVAAYQGSIPWTIGSVYGNISGSVAAFQAGTQITSLVSITPSSVQVGASIMGQLPAGVAMVGSVVTYQGVVPWIVTGSVQTGNTSISGTINAVLVGTNVSVITLNQGSSILAVPVGSIITVFQAPSIVGTYAEDAAHTSGDKGVFSLNVRNDTLSSITSTDSDYSPIAVGPMGEVITANAPITKWVYGTTSIVSGPSVALIAAQGASIFTYVTGLNIANFSANNLTGNLSTGAGASSVLVYFVAPANGGSNMLFPNGLRSRDNTAILASISGVGSVYLSAQGFISKT